VGEEKFMKTFVCLLAMMTAVSAFAYDGSVPTTGKAVNRKTANTPDSMDADYCMPSAVSAAAAINKANSTAAGVGKMDTSVGVMGTADGAWGRLFTVTFKNPEGVEAAEPMFNVRTVWSQDAKQCKIFSIEALN
jgi:hypothetical protein